MNLFGIGMFFVDSQRTLNCTKTALKVTLLEEGKGYGSTADEDLAMTLPETSI